MNVLKVLHWTIVSLLAADAAPAGEVGVLHVLHLGTA